MDTLRERSFLPKLATILAIAMFVLCLMAAITGGSLAFYYTPSTYIQFTVIY